MHTYEQKMNLPYSAWMASVMLRDTTDKPKGYVYRDDCKAYCVLDVSFEVFIGAERSSSSEKQPTRQEVDVTIRSNVYVSSQHVSPLWIRKQI